MPAPHEGSRKEPTGETRLPLSADRPAVPTPIAPGKEGSSRHQVPDARLPVRPPPRRMPTPIPDDEDAVTHVSGDWPVSVPSAPLGAAAPPRPPLPGTGPVEPRRDVQVFVGRCVLELEGDDDEAAADGDPARRTPARRGIGADECGQVGERRGRYEQQANQ